MKFKPQLAPNDIPDLNDIKYPLLGSYKLDGIRCIFYKGEILSRSLKFIQNIQLKEKFESLRQFSEINDLIIDGEIYSPYLTFQEITSFVMTQDFTDERSRKKYNKILQIPDHLKFHCFDIVTEEDFDEPFESRYNKMINYITNFRNIAVVVSHKLFNNKEDIEDHFRQALKDGYEGLILRNPKGRYKCGRGTLKEGLIYKAKPFETFDAKITGVVQSTIVNPKAEKKKNKLGRSVTSKKKGDRILIEKASAFWVEYQGKPLKVVLAMTDEEKEAVWASKDDYVGKYIEYKGLLVGSKDVPRHPVMIRFRTDKDEN